MRLRIQVDRQALADFCRRHHVRHLYFFGSVVRDDFGPASDVDVLVEFEEGKTPGFGFIGMQEELERMLGRKVDLLTPGFFQPHNLRRVMAEAEVAFAAT